MSEYSLEKVKDFNLKIAKVLKNEKSLQVDTFMAEDVVEYAENSMKWTDHKWEIDLSEDAKTVKRDGVDWDNVHFVGVKHEFDDVIPKLIVESDFNGFDIHMNEDGTQEIYYKGELIEEVQSYQIINDPKNDYITRIRLTLIGDAEINWDYKVERGERENPNISFPKINYHTNPALTEQVYKEVTDGSNVKQLTEGEFSE